jgi:hypothetical protein
MPSDASFEHVLSNMENPKEAPPQGDMSATENPLYLHVQCDPLYLHVQCDDDANQPGKRDATDIAAMSANQKSSSEHFLRDSVSSGTMLVPSASTVSLTANLSTDSTTADVHRSNLSSCVFTGGVVDTIKDHLAKQNVFALWKFSSKYQRMNTGKEAVGVSSMTTGEVEHRARARLENEPSRRTEQSTETLSLFHSKTTNNSDPEQHKAALTIQRLHHRFASSCSP